jgi:hypothetical protein
MTVYDAIVLDPSQCFVYSPLVLVMTAIEYSHTTYMIMGYLFFCLFLF